MKPPMNNQAVVISKDKTKQPDRHGDYPEKRQETAARVTLTTQYIRGTDGTYRQARLEVDFPPEVVLNDGDRIDALDNSGTWQSGQIIRIDESNNFAGNRTFFRTVYCE